MIRVRMDAETLKALDKCATIIGVSKSQAVRLAISYLQKAIQEDKT